MALEYVPEIHMTDELCRIAVEQDGEALRYVPEKHKTPELVALVSPVRPKWNVDILKELYSHSPQPVRDARISV
jgi:hypothetical protein